MPISSITSQPATDSLNAVYRPVSFTVTATATDGTAKPPVVFCDIYINSIYYKSLSKTQYTTLGGSSSTWSFDIQDALQEYIKPYLPANGGSSILTASPVIATVQVKFRSSGINGSGFIVAENTAPVQGTGNTAPVSGTGTSSNSFFVLNVTLQHQDNQNLATHLASYRTGTWNASFYPLTHRPKKYILSRSASDYYPAISGSGVAFMALKYRFINQSTIRELIISASTTGTAVYIPNGVKNIKTLFPTLDFINVYDYWVELRNSSNVVLLTTPTNVISVGESTEKIRIHFQNYLGTVDAIDFCETTINHETKSDTFKVPLASPLVKSVHAASRFNVRSNDTYYLKSSEYGEADMEWIDELLDSPLAWMEWKGVQGQADDYIPIVILDKKTEKKKVDDRFIYEISLDFSLSHEKITLRN